MEAPDLSTNVAGEVNPVLDLCEECGSPLQGGRCPDCGIGFSDGSSPDGAAPLGRSELSKILGRRVGVRAYGSYSLSMQQGEGMARLRKEIGMLVEQFNASPEVKAAVKQNADQLSIKIVGDLGPTKAAIVSVANEFIARGKSLLEIGLCVSKVHPKIGRVRDLVIEVYPTSTKVGVLVDGKERGFKSYGEGLYRKLRIPLFVGDGSATVELENARLTSEGYDAKRINPLGASKFLLKIEERSFELFKVLTKARLSGATEDAEVKVPAMFKRYPISKLPLTERLLKEAGVLQDTSAEYRRLCAEKASDGRGRSPRKLAEEALIKACKNVASATLSDLIVHKYSLKPSALNSLILKTELNRW